MQAPGESDLEFPFEGLDFKPERLLKLKGDINLLLARLETSPAALHDLSAFSQSSMAYMTRGGKPEWKSYAMALTGDILTFNKMNGTGGALPRFQYEICYASMAPVAQEDDMTRLQQSKGISTSKKRLKVLTFGEVITITFRTDEDASSWWSLIKKMLRAKYSREELVEKEESRRALEPLLDQQERLLWAKHNAIVKALAASGFWIGKEKKHHEGYLYERPRDKKQESKKYYVVLYRDFLYFFKPHDRVNEKPADIIALQFISELGFEKNRPHRFHITTPLRRIILHVKHYMAAILWLTAISERLETLKVPATRNFDKRKAKFDTSGYVYAKPVQGRMRAVLRYGEKEVKYKLKKQDIITIGRSASCDIRCKVDRHLSRQHCKIVVEKNVPFIVDLGQSKDGTLLNGKKVKTAALKPGDVIHAGTTEVHFSVKNPLTMFNQVVPNPNNDKKKHKITERK